MSTIHFTAELLTIGSWNLIKLPKDASGELPSRGIAMVKGAINDIPFQTALEPDGRGSHWFRVDAALGKAAGVEVGDHATLELEPTKEWPEPEVPADITKALTANGKAHAQWVDITPMARWEWIRWIRATSRQETRARRIEVACSKLNAGQRRPCCFNSSMCTEPSVSKNGVLLEVVRKAQV